MTGFWEEIRKKNLRCWQVKQEIPFQPFRKDILEISGDAYHRDLIRAVCHNLHEAGWASKERRLSSKGLS